jgi:hypothetical protein
MSRGRCWVLVERQNPLRLGCVLADAAVQPCSSCRSGAVDQFPGLAEVRRGDRQWTQRRKDRELDPIGVEGDIVDESLLDQQSERVEG